MSVSNEAVLDGLHLALFRQVPWHKRPTIFSALHKIDLIRPVRQQLAVGARYPAFDIAAITERGRAEVDRLERCQRTAAWEVERHADYPYGAVRVTENVNEQAPR
jgi:hypothetical protein